MSKKQKPKFDKFKSKYYNSKNLRQKSKKCRIMSKKERREMSVIRVNKNKNYTTMSNFHLKDKNLSLKAIGLLSKMLSLPEDWDYSISGLTKLCKEGERSIKSALDELKENKYLIVTKMYPNQTESKTIQYIYDIYEQPIKVNDEVNINVSQGVHFVGLDNVPLQNVGQLNTNNKKTKYKEKLNKKKSYKNYDQREYENLNSLYANSEKNLEIGKI